MPTAMLRDTVSGAWYVASESGPRTVYRVAPDASTCSCPDAWYRRRECKHRRAVRAHLGGVGTLTRRGARTQTAPQFRFPSMSNPAG